MSYFGLPQQTARKAAAAAATVCGILAVAGSANRAGALYTEQRLLLAVGVLTGALLGMVIEHVAHRPVSRRVLWPWGALGGALVVLAAASQTTSLVAHGSFIVATVLRGVLAAACVRFAIDAAAGPLVHEPELAAPIPSDLPIWDDVQKWAPARADAPVAVAPVVVSPEPAVAEPVVVKPPRKKRKSGSVAVIPAVIPPPVKAAEVAEVVLRAEVPVAAAETPAAPKPAQRRKSRPIPAVITPVIPSSGVARFLE